MPIPPALALAGIGLQLGGNLLQGAENYKAAKQEAGQLLFEAGQVEQEGREQAKVIKKQGRTVLGGATVELATGGFRLDTAQGVQIREEIVRNVEHDAMNAVLTGDLQAMQMRQRAREIRKAAKKGRGLGALVAVAGAGTQAYMAGK